MGNFINVVLCQSVPENEPVYTLDNLPDDKLSFFDFSQRLAKEHKLTKEDTFDLFLLLE